MINKKKLFISMLIILALIFSITYYVSSKYISNKNIQNNSVRAENDSDKSDELDDNTKICLFAGGKKEKELTLAELKKELNLDNNLNQAELSKELRDKGYVLEIESGGEISYKEDKLKSVKPNRYYIGEKNGYLAIYKTDENGALLIENSNDVYSNSKKIDSLNDIDKNKIKNFELEYNSKEDAEESLSEYLS